MKTDVLIIGAGFAGAATAYHLAGSFFGSVVVVDKEEIPGFHASGRNASLVLQSVEHSTVRRIVAKSRMAYLERSKEVGYKAVGSLLLGTEEQLRLVRDPDIIDSEYLSADEVCKSIPVLEGHNFEAALLTPSDGVMDISRLLQFYLNGARRHHIELKLDCQVTSLSKTRSSFVAETTKGVIEAGMVVDAAGAWAPSIANMAGIHSLPMNSFKRHLFVLEHKGCSEAQWPFVWSLDKNFYFRPESGGLLFSVCDEELSGGEFAESINEEVVEALAERISAELPELEDALYRRVWSCFRTKTPDGGFHIGQSEELEGFIWVAGLGGHGMGASWEVGRLAAEAIQRM